MDTSDIKSAALEGFNLGNAFVVQAFWEKDRLPAKSITVTILISEVNYFKTVGVGEKNLYRANVIRC